jgi:hypothetical protein
MDYTLSTWSHYHEIWHIWAYGNLEICSEFAGFCFFGDVFLVSADTLALTAWGNVLWLSSGAVQTPMYYMAELQSCSNTHGRAMYQHYWPGILCSYSFLFQFQLICLNGFIPWLLIHVIGQRLCESLPPHKSDLFKIWQFCTLIVTVL